MLKHHPDKRKAAGEQIVEGDGDYFTCITKGKDIEKRCQQCHGLFKSRRDHMHILKKEVPLDNCLI